ncbi:MAG TPA: DUF3106 domain-containing protein [Gammaproteobacteria bacterium]|jgi:uncharacterized membrane protein YccC
MSSKLIAALLLGLTLGLAHAAEPLPWEQLGEAEQQVLEPYAGRWESFSPEQQQRLQQGARRWQAMDSEERAAVRERFERWQQMPAEQKQRIRERYSEYQGLPPAQQQRIREQMEAFRRMPAEQREQLLQRWQSLSEEERQALRAQLRAEAATRQPVVPPGTEEAGAAEPEQGEPATFGNGNGERFRDNRMERRGIDTPMRRPR